VPAGHEPVLVDEVVRLVAGGPGEYLDATVGGGGHAEALLHALPAEARLLGLDRDREAVEAASRRLREFGDRFIPVHASFDQLGEVMSALGLRSLAGALFDLGLSSLQLVDDSRGFSFRPGGQLDLRFNPEEGESAAGYLARVDARELSRVLSRFGEIPDSSAVARLLVEARERSPIRTTDDLRAALKSRWGPSPHPRKMAQLFQALRIAVNDELGRLDRALAEVPKRLETGAVLAVISYHSLEDRRVKRLMSGPARSRREARLGLPEDGDWEVMTRGAIRPTAMEVARNPRARSARLRAARKRRPT
jgi:16S rRNA (cytosine1402-N4)-methyltransferase